MEVSAASVANAPSNSSDVTWQAETDAVQSNLDSHEGDTSNPHQVDGSQVNGVVRDPVDSDVDFNGYSVTNAQSVGVEDIQYSPDSRPLSTTSDLTIYVDPTGSDSADGTETDPVATVQEAVDRVPTFLRHPVTIELANGTYDEDVFLRGVFAHHDQLVHGNDDSGHVSLLIRGDPDTPSNVQVGSFYTVGTHGASVPFLSGIEWQRESPYSGEGGSVCFHHCSNAAVRSCTWADNGILKGVMSYSTAHVSVNDCDFGTDILSHAVQQKDPGECHLRNNCRGSVTGSKVMVTHGGNMSIRSEVTLTGDQPNVDHGSTLNDWSTGLHTGIAIPKTESETSQVIDTSNNSVPVVAGLQRLTLPDGASSATVDTITTTGEAYRGARVTFYGTFDGDVTVTDGTDNIWLMSGDHTLSGEFDMLDLVCRDGDNWQELSRTSR